ncbi:thermonuclease family protein [Aminobacter sp. AP02]|uniref:thermonuclease family protein n=1 Tax=Aminobacter sp. AP02 TaxID=2135737 RepID=UPI000D7B902E|nr:thermonuclease family protein [Aminobacter sp. AP02]PWK76280.1 endonuclease YncB(thermonuclease family) [Aminobacter sp. AP02]
MDSISFKVAAMLAVVFLTLGLSTTAEAKRRDNFAGPVTARVVEVLDGDTFLADAEIWPGQTLRVNIRIRGIDAPEMKARCQSERDAAHAARAALARLMAEGPVSLSNIGGAKYYGRVLADVSTEAGEAIAATMLENGLVRTYGGGKRAGWCG